MSERQVAWSEGTWTHAPAAVEEEATGLAVTAVEGSDAWRHTSYGFVHDTEHALLAPLAVGEAVEVTLQTRFTGQFDQAGVFVRADDEHWVKAGLEFADGVLNLGAVVTLGRSDWSVAPVDWNGSRVTVRVSRAEESLTVRARVDDEPFRLVRVAPFVGGDVAAGPFLCAPTRAGFTARFLGWRTTAADTALH
jgi:regulation of enolase protein 1 (concanavalin A-like superfamily)